MVLSLIVPGLTKTQFAVDSHRSFVIQGWELPFQSTYISHTNHAWFPDHVVLVNLGSKFEGRDSIADFLEEFSRLEDVTADDSNKCSFAKWAC